MGKGRIEAFSDAVIAIIITIMVLELHPPEEASLEALRPLAAVFFSYVLSFVILGVYWNNHHQYFQGVEHVDGSVLWANLHLLFWLSLIPFTTTWMGQHSFAKWPVFTYGAVLFAASLAFYLLQRRLLACNGPDSVLARALRRDRKAMLSNALWIIGAGVASIAPIVALGIYALTVAMWLIPDRRMEPVTD